MAERYVGIDIGSCYIKIANVIVKRSSIIIDNPVVLRTPGFLVRNGRLTDSTELVTLLKSAFSQRKPASKRAMVILNDSLLVTREMELPAVNSKELMQIIKMDVSEFLPYAVDEYTIRYKTLLPADKNPKGTNYILMSALKNDLANDFIEVLQKAGLKPEAFDVSINGMRKYAGRILAGGYEELKSINAFAMLDMGASTIKLSIFSKGLPAYQYIISSSSQKLDVIISNSLNVERQEAEDLKIKYGLDHLYSYTDDELSANVASLIRPQVDSMLADVYTHLNNYMGRNGAVPIEHILLCGGFAGMKGLIQYIGNAFSVPCTAVRPFAAVRFTTLGSAELFPQFVNMAGAACRGD